MSVIVAIRGDVAQGWRFKIRMHAYPPQAPVYPPHIPGEYKESGK